MTDRVRLTGLRRRNDDGELDLVHASPADLHGATVETARHLGDRDGGDARWLARDEGLSDDVVILPSVGFGEAGLAMIYKQAFDIAAGNPAGRP